MINKQIIFDFFISKGLLGPAIYSKTSIKEYSEPLYEEVQNFIEQFYPDSEKKYSELMYCYLKDLFSNPKCPECEKDTKFKQFSHGYFEYCSTSCSSNSEKKRKTIEETCLEKYGHRNVAHGTEREKILKTFDDKYGGYPAACDEVKDKMKNTCIQRYGCEYATQSDNLKEKSKNTFLERYGVENPSQVPEFMEKILKTSKKNGHIFKWIGKELEEWKHYKKAVWFFSNQNFCLHYYQINPNHFKRSKTEYHLDHIFSIYNGWLNKVDPKDIAHPKNLQMLWCSENLKKGHRTQMTLEDFYTLIEKDKTN